MFGLISTSSIPPLLISYGYLILFPVCIIEGPIATVIAGFLVSLGYFNLILVYLVAFAGDLVGDLIYYGIGRWGTRIISKKGKFLGISIAHARNLESHFKKHAGKTLLFGKWTQTVGAPILVAAGMAKMSMKKFLIFNSIGSTPKVLIFVLVGFYFGKAYQQIDEYFGYAAAFIIFIFIFLTSLYIFLKIIKKKIAID